MTLALSFNSQMWRKDAAGRVWMLGGDVGYGLGWKLQAGSIRAVWKDTSSSSHYIFEDASGAKYRLDVNTNSSHGVHPPGSSAVLAL